jgi:hypothetical protein
MLDSDIKKYHAAEVSKLATNGGRCGTTLIVSGVVNNVWPHVPKAERTAGAFLYRKIFTAADDDNDGTLMSAQEFIDRPTLGGDWIVAFVGTATDTQGDITGAMTGTDTERKYGAAYIKNPLTAGNSTITVTVEHTKFASGAEAIFQAGDTIQLKDKLTPDAVAGNQEDHVISTIDSVVDLDVTFTVVGTFANSYAVDGNSRCVSVIDYGDTACSTENYSVTAAGDYAFDSGSYPVITDNIGTVEDHLTGEWIDAANYTLTGSSGIAYGSGTFGADFSPTNTAKGKKYLTIEAAAHSGTPQAGDIFELDIHEAKYATWFRREVPEDCPSLANNKVTTVTVGESDQ